MPIPTLTDSVDRVLVIGLDCGSPHLFFERWADALPNITALRQRGFYGCLRSCHPPITVPAWRIMASGADAGQQGVYGFRNRTGPGYGDMGIADADAFRAAPLWSDLAKQGLRSTLIGVPGTWPPRATAGKLISGPLTPDDDAPFAAPPALERRVAEIAPDYAFDVRDFRNLDPDDLMAQVTQMTDARFDVTLALAKDDDWNMLWMVEIGLDRLYHALWHHIDPEHPRYNPDPARQAALLAYHQLLDRRIGQLWEACDDGDTALLIVSDHGARSMHGGVCLNVWLQRNGYQVLKPGVPEGQRFDPQYIDWSQTRAWAWGGYYGRVFVNLEGREPEGIVTVEELPVFLDQLAKDLANIPAPDGEPLGVEVHRPADLYPDGVQGRPPDLFVYLGDLAWRSIDALTPDRLHVTENDTGPDSANHDWDGLLVASGAEVPERGTVDGMRLVEVADWVRCAVGIG